MPTLLDRARSSSGFLAYIAKPAQASRRNSSGMRRELYGRRADFLDPLFPPPGPSNASFPMSPAAMPARHGAVRIVRSEATTFAIGPSATFRSAPAMSASAPRPEVSGRGTDRPFLDPLRTSKDFKAVLSALRRADAEQARFSPVARHARRRIRSDRVLVSESLT